MDINIHKEKKIYIWGTGHVEESFECFLKNRLLLDSSFIANRIEGYIDTYKSGTYKGKRIYDIDEVDKNNAYFIVAVHDYNTIESKLKNFGLQLGRDYICISQNYNNSDLQKINYESFNLISGNVDVETLEISECSELNIGESTCLGRNVSIILSGFSKLIINDSCSIGDNVCIRCENGSQCYIGENTRICSGSEIITSSHSTVSVAKDCVLPTKLVVSGKSSFTMGKGTDFDEDTNVRVLNESRVDIGNDCMFSYNVSIRGEDGHSIINIKEGTIVERPKSVTLGNHIWAGMGSIFLPGTEVGDGSIIGAGSIVNKSFGKNVEVVGVPGRVVKDQVSWDRKPPHLLSSGFNSSGRGENE